MGVYVNHHAEAVRLFGPAPDLHLYDEGFLLAPGGSVEFNATDDDWLTVRVDGSEVWSSQLASLLREPRAILCLDAISKSQNYLSYAFMLSLAMAHESYASSGQWYKHRTDAKDRV